MIKKNYIKIVSIGFLATILTFMGVTIHAHAAKYSTTVVMDPQYPVDYSNDEILMGASHNIFVGKVLSQIGSKSRGPTPETQFEVRVIENTKGDLRGIVTVNQDGGYKDGTLYIIGDDTLSDGNSGLLQPGSTYLFATRYYDKENWYTLNSYPTALKLISNDANANDAQLQTTAENDARVAQLKNAYPKEILLYADVASNNARNSYHSLHPGSPTPLTTRDLNNGTANQPN